MPVLLETCSGSTGDLQLGQRDKRLHLIWDWLSEQSALREDGYLKKFWLLTVVVFQAVTCVMLLGHADMCCGETEQHFLPSGLGKQGEEDACCSAQERFEKADQYVICPQDVTEFPWCMFPIFLALPSSRASSGRIVTLPLTLVGAPCREGNVCSNGQKRVEKEEWESLGLRGGHSSVPIYTNFS